MSATSSPVLPELPSGYEYRKQVATGAQGTVWLVLNRNMGTPGRYEAVKLVHNIDEIEYQRFCQEINTLATLNHPNIVTIYNANAKERYFIMEYLRGGTLSDLIKKRSLSTYKLLQFLQQIMQGLHFAHNKGLIHRDLKPRNILFSENMIPKITDFGLVKAIKVKDTGMTAPQICLGTPNYMAPEQWNDARTVDHRCDIWSLGIILYSVVAQEMPFAGATVPSLMCNILTRPAVPPTGNLSALENALEPIYMRALEKDPEHRYPNAKQMAQDLGKVLRKFSPALNVTEQMPVQRRARSRSTQHMPTMVNPPQIEESFEPLFAKQEGEKPKASSSINNVLDDGLFSAELKTEDEAPAAAKPSSFPPSTMELKKQQKVERVRKKTKALIKPSRPVHKTTQELPKQEKLARAAKKSTMALPIQEKSSQELGFIEDKLPTAPVKSPPVKQASSYEELSFIEDEPQQQQRPRHQSQHKSKPVPIVKTAPPLTLLLQRIPKKVFVGIAAALLVISALFFILKPPAFSTLRAYISSGNVDQQLYALNILQKNRDNQSYSLVAQALNSKSAEVQRIALNILQKAHNKAVPALIEVLEYSRANYTLAARLRLLELLATPVADKACETIFAMAIADESEDTLRQTAIATLIAIDENYRNDFVEFQGRWFHNKALQQKGYVKIQGVWRKSAELVDEPSRKIDHAHQNFRKLQKQRQKYQRAIMGLANADKIPEILRRWNLGIKDYKEALTAVKDLQEYDANNAMLQELVLPLEARIGEDVREYLNESFLLGKSFEGIKPIFAYNIYQDIHETWAQIDIWPWSASQLQKLDSVYQRVVDSIRGLERRLGVLVVVKVIGDTLSGETNTWLKRQIERLFTRNRKIPEFTTLQQIDSEATGWFVIKYREQKSAEKMRLASQIAYWRQNDTAKRVWHKQISKTLPITAINKARLEFAKLLQAWQPQWDEIAAMPIVQEQTREEKVYRSTLYRQNATDKIHLKDGRVLQGLIKEENEEHLVLVSFWQQSKGSKMLVSQKIAVEDIDNIERLPKDVRQFRLKMAAASKNSYKGEKKAMRSIVLENCKWPFSQANAKMYSDQRFMICSNAPEDFLRSVAFRMREIFTAYQKFFHVQRNQEQKIKIYVFNSMEEYYSATGKQILNPAFYLPAKNYIIAGCDLALYKREIAKIRHHHNKIRKRIERANIEVKNLRKKIRNYKREKHWILDKYLRRGKIDKYRYDEAYRKIRMWEERQQKHIRKYQKGIKKLEHQLLAADYSNYKLVQKYAGKMLKLLYHEAFHAFLQNFLFAEKTVKAVPLWLNEGMAQFFENSFIEGNVLLIGKMDKDRINLLRGYIREQKTIPLRQFLVADSREFLVKDLSNLENSNIHYLQAWALVYYIAQKYDLSQGNFFESYVNDLNNGADPVKAFQKLIQEPIDQIDQTWQQKLLEWK